MTEATSVLAGVITSEMVSGVFNELVALLPVLVPPMVTFIGLRKGLSFVQSVLHSA